MTEPKPMYEVGQWLLLADNNIIEYTKTENGLHYGYYQTEPYLGKEDWFDDGNVIGIIRIIPITDKPYCKDCKKTARDDCDDLNYTVLCPKGMASNYKSVINYQDYEPAVLAEQGDESQPPDNCYCFEPKDATSKDNNANKTV